MRANQSVLKCTLLDGSIVDVSPRTFGLVDFNGAIVSGENHYIEKAVKLGAKRKVTRKKKQAV